MSWVRVDDGFSENPKILELDDRTFRIHVWALCYCARHLTDGLLVLGVLRGCPLVTRKYTLDRVLGCLVGAGLWEPVEGGYLVHDYLVFNPAAAKVREKRAAAAERQRRWRDNKEKRQRRDSNGVTPKGSNAHPDPAPKAGEGAAPRGAPQILDDCAGCGEHRPLTDHGTGPLLCDECERAAA
jgi:hypothetical protein